MNVQTDPKKLVTGQYKDTKPLNIRQAYNDQFKPRIDLDEEIRKVLQNDKTGDILDIGCGNGNTLIYLRKNGFSGKMIGIDISDGIMQPGKKVASECHLEFQNASADNLPFGENTFDIVIARHMLYHMPDVAKVMQEVKRVLKPGGKFIITLNSMDNKPIFNHIIQKIKEKFGFVIVRNANVINTENIQRFLAPHFSFSVYEFRTSYPIESTSPFIEYFKTYQTTFERELTESEWRDVLTEAERELSSLMAKDSNLHEYNVGSVITANL